MKKFIFAVAALLAVAMMFTACGKKDDVKDEAVTQTQQVEEDTQNTDAEQEEAPAQETAEEKEEPKAEEKVEKQEAKSEEKSEAPAEKQEEPASQITNEEGEPVTSEEFEDLVETFNNTDDEEAKEEARKQLEAILKQAEANAQ